MEASTYSSITHQESLIQLHVTLRLIMLFYLLAMALTQQLVLIIGLLRTLGVLGGEKADMLELPEILHIQVQLEFVDYSINHCTQVSLESTYKYPHINY